MSIEVKLKKGKLVEASQDDFVVVVTMLLMMS